MNNWLRKPKILLSLLFIKTIKNKISLKKKYKLGYINYNILTVLYTNRDRQSKEDKAY